MKILVVSQYFYPEPFRINTICQELVARGHDVTVMTAYPQYPEGEIYEGYGFDIPYETEWNGVHIHRVKTHPRGHNALGLLRNCVDYVVAGNRWVRRCKEKYDRVFVFGLSPATLALPAVTYKKKFGTPVYYYLQDLWPESVHEVMGIRFPPLTYAINRIVNCIYKHSDVILCTSNGYIQNLKGKGVPAHKMVYWPQFCMEQDFAETQKPSIYGEDTFNVVFTGNIGDAQGLDLLVETADKLKGKGVRFYLVGDGRAKERLEQLVKQRGIQDDVIFVGRVSEEEANRYVHFADCAYLSFRSNPLFDLVLPAKLQTYLACGAPILAAASGESAEVINEAQCGITVSPQVDDLVQAVQKMVSLSSEQRKTMADNARQYSKEHFDKDALINELLERMNKA